MDRHPGEGRGPDKSPHTIHGPIMPRRKSILLQRNKTANLSVDDHLLEQDQRQREKWLRKNRAALDAYNEHVEKHGVFSDGLRSF